jgi:ABC-type glutathione transport system ATPase component
MKIVSNNESSLRKQATDTPAIEIAGVSKVYRTHDGEIPSVSAVDLSVSDGEFVVIVGPSGCGKDHSAEDDFGFACSERGRGAR